MVISFISGGASFGAMFTRSPLELDGSVAVKVRIAVGRRLGSPLMTLSHLLIQLSRAITRGRAVAR